MGLHVTDDYLKRLWLIAIRDDAFNVLVPSDVRQLIREVERLRATLEQVRAAKMPGEARRIAHIALTGGQGSNAS